MVAGIPAIASALGSAGLSAGAATAGSSILTNAMLGAAASKLRGGSAFEGAAMGGLSAGIGGTPGWGGLLGLGTPPPTTTPSGTGVTTGAGQGGTNELSGIVPAPAPVFQPGELPPLPDPLEMDMFKYLQQMGLN